MTDPLYRDRKKTPVSIPDFFRVVGAALSAIYPDVTQKGVATLWAQYALETGRGAACWCNNLGNKRAQDGEPYCELAAAWECGTFVPAGSRQIAPPPGSSCAPGELVYLPPNQRFAAFDTLEAGAEAYVALLSRPRYLGALQAALRGDPTAFALELKARGYYTADSAQYAASLRSLQAEALRSAPPMPSSPSDTEPGSPPPAPDFESGHVVDTSGFEPPAPKLGENDDDPDAEGFLHRAMQLAAERVQETCNLLVCGTTDDPPVS